MGMGRGVRRMNVGDVTGGGMVQGTVEFKRGMAKGGEGVGEGDKRGEVGG